VPIIAGAGGPALCDRLRAGSRAGGCAGHPAAAALSDRGRAKASRHTVEPCAKARILASSSTTARRAVFPDDTGRAGGTLP
jgi:hypothetical protein